MSTCATLFLSENSNGKLLRQFDQPENIHYGPYDSYAVLIREGNTKWNHLDFHKTLDIKFVKKDEPAYGHSIELDITGIDAEGIAVIWEPTGINLITKSGHKLWVPKKSFIGGR